MLHKQRLKQFNVAIEGKFITKENVTKVWFEEFLCSSIESRFYSISHFSKLSADNVRLSFSAFPTMDVLNDRE